MAKVAAKKVVLTDRVLKALKPAPADIGYGTPRRRTSVSG